MLYMRVTTEEILGLELVAIHGGDDWRDTGAGAGGYTEGTSGFPSDGKRRSSSTEDEEEEEARKDKLFLKRI